MSSDPINARAHLVLIDPFMTISGAHDYISAYFALADSDQTLILISVIFSGIPSITDDIDRVMVLTPPAQMTPPALAAEY